MIILRFIEKLEPIPLAAPSKTWVCSRPLAGIAGSKPGEKRGCLVIVVCCQVGVCDRPIPRIEESYRVCVCACVCVTECDQMHQ